jgi:hypothetical protein
VDSETGEEKPCLEGLLYDSLLRQIDLAQKATQVADEVWKWASKPRDPGCMSHSMARGGAVGMAAGGTIGLAGGPGGFVTVPTGAGIGFLGGAGAGGLGGLITCTTNVGPSSGSGGGNDEEHQLQAKFKHAEDFGVKGNWNKANAAQFKTAIQKHLGDPATRLIKGTYRGQSVTHHVNPQSGLNVMKDSSGNFISGWKLNPQQLQNVLTRGSL